MDGRPIFPGDRLRELEVTLVEEFSGLDIVLEIHLARDSCKTPCTARKRVFAVPPDLGAIRGVPGGEPVRCADRAACRSVGQATNEGFGADLLVDPARCAQNDFVRVGVPAADEIPCHFDRRIDAWEVGAFVGADEHAYPRYLCVARCTRWRRCGR